MSHPSFILRPDSIYSFALGFCGPWGVLGFIGNLIFSRLGLTLEPSKRLSNGLQLRAEFLRTSDASSADCELCFQVVKNDGNSIPVQLLHSWRVGAFFVLRIRPSNDRGRGVVGVAITVGSQTTQFQTLLNEYARTRAEAHCLLPWVTGLKEAGQ